MRKLFAVCAAVLALTVAIVLPCAAVETTAEPEIPAIDWSYVKVSSLSDTGIWRGGIVPVDSGNINSGTRAGSLDTSTGVFTVGVKAAYNYPVYILVSGATVSNLHSSSNYISVTLADAPTWETLGTSRYVSPSYVAAPASWSDVPADAVWVRFVGTSSTSAAEGQVSFSVTPVEPPVPSSFDNVLSSGRTLFAAMLGYGSAFIDFFVARPILVIPLALYVLIALYGFFKSLLVGVK